jgi:hypothetical protein
VGDPRDILCNPKGAPQVYLAIEFREGIESAWERIATFVPKLLGFLLILIIGYFVAKALAGILNRVLERVGFDRLVERGGFRDALARSRFDASDILSRVVFWAIFLFVLQLAFGVFGPNPVSDLIKGLIAYLPNIFVAIIILVIAGALAKAVSELLQAMLGGVGGGQIIARVAAGAVLLVGVFAALDQLQIAPRIVQGLFYAILAIIVGSAVVAIGGGGIETMRRYWERSATKVEERGPQLTQQMQQQGPQAREQLKQRAQQATQEVRTQPGDSSPGSTRRS